MNRPFGLLFHRLKGSPGWSSLNLHKVDVARVTKVEWCRRPFMILDRDRPYTLQLTYFKPSKTMVSYPEGSFEKRVITEETNLEEQCLITKRYETEEDVIEEIQEIEDKQRKLDLYMAELAQKIMKEQ